MTNSGSLFRRLFLGILISFLCLTLFFFAITTSFVEKKTEALFDNMLLAVATNIQEKLVMKRGELHLNMDYFSIDSLSTARNEKVFYRIENAENKLLAGAIGLKFYQQVNPDRNDSKRRYYYYDTVYAGTELRAVEVHFPYSKGIAKIVIAESLQGRQQILNEITLFMSMAAIVLCIISAVITYLTLKWGLNPIRRIQKQISTRSEFNLNPIVTRAPTEISELISALNRLMLRLQKTIDNTQRFNADLSHQLKTPLAEMKMQIELYKKEPELQKIEFVEKKIQYMTRLTQQLLHYAKSKRDLIDEEFWQNADLVELCKAVCIDMAPAIYADQQQLVFHSSTDSLIRNVDPIMLQTALINLVENAHQYGRQSEMANQIEVSIQHNPVQNQVVITVEDSGPGIPEPQLEYVTEPHVSLNKLNIGNGLGLTIVKQVCEQHDLMFHIINKPDGGIKVSLTGFKQ
ncbi:MAG: sensor histidine kinase [Aliivibrio sp.]|uniref:sensor histidine kinase n=1 Tax=Aliivibrio sp. TaxID=1872443 RepID=UPI001A553EA0|nr:sensor histidine kinase [Aliivibrio sp.]